MSHYQHLSITERESIWEQKIQGCSFRQIGKAIGRSPSTIMREINRNKGKGYRPSNAQAQYHKRRTHCHRKRLLDDQALRDKVVYLLVQQQWSPEQISQRLSLENTGKLSYNTIYRALKSGQMEQAGTKREKGKYPLQKKLRRKGTPKGQKKPRGTIKIEQTIEQRPKAADTRSRYGDWEGDTVCVGRGRGYILTFVDRRSRLLLAGSCPSKNQTDTANAMLRILATIPKNKLHTITLDRGSEFSEYQKVSRHTGVSIFFANPYSPWERGLNENTNGLLREYVPKRSYTKPYSDELLGSFVQKLNLRPRKCLGWKTPYEVFFRKSLHLT